MSSPPHPSETGPQFAPAIAHVRGTQPDVPPHRLGIPPPPQVCGDVHEPQLMIPPQPSPTGPQVAPADSQVTSPQPRRASSLPVSYAVMMSGPRSTVASIPITPGWESSLHAARRIVAAVIRRAKSVSRMVASSSQTPP